MLACASTSLLFCSVVPRALSSAPFLRPSFLHRARVTGRSVVAVVATVAPARSRFIFDRVLGQLVVAMAATVAPARLRSVFDPRSSSFRAVGHRGGGDCCSGSFALCLRSSVLHRALVQPLGNFLVMSSCICRSYSGVRKQVCVTCYRYTRHYTLRHRLLVNPAESSEFLYLSRDGTAAARSRTGSLLHLSEHFPSFITSVILPKSEQCNHEHTHAVMRCRCTAG